MESNRTHRWMRAAATAIAFATSLTSCNADISPQPEPPIRQDGFEVDFGAVEATVDSYTNAPSGLRGEPGSAKPAGATVRATNLDGVDDPVEGIIAPDGSFDLQFSVAIGDEVRVQIFSGDRRSDPFDVVVENDQAPPKPSTRALGSCLKLTPSLEVVLAGAAGTVRVDNACAEAVELGAPHLRRPVPGLAIGATGTWPAVVPAGGSLEVSVATDATTPTPMSEVVFLEAIAPQADRRPITVWRNK